MKKFVLITLFALSMGNTAHAYDIVIRIPDAVAVEVLDNLAVKYNYPAQVIVDGELVDNPQTKAQFVKGRIISILKNHSKKGHDKRIKAADTSYVEPDIATE